ncbi:hypothetical protein PT2222_140194 [Paraburkholderia tropica]
MSQKGFGFTLRLEKEGSTNNDQQDEQHYDQYETASVSATRVSARISTVESHNVTSFSEDST